MRGFDLGEGVSVSIGNGENIDYFYTNKMPSPEGLPMKLEVEISASQTDDKELLHYLLTKVREQKLDI